MTREEQRCAWCGMTNPRTSHYRLDNKRFCSRVHFNSYKKSLEQSFERTLEDKKMNGVVPYCTND